MNLNAKKKSFVKSLPKSFPKSFAERNKIIFLCFLFFSLILIVRLFLVQVINSDLYADRANKQYFTPASSVFKRGNIFFQKKNGELISGAMQIDGFKLAINPNKIGNPEEFYKKLLKKINSGGLDQINLDFNKEEFLAKAKNKKRTYVEIFNNLSKKEIDIIMDEKIPGVTVYKEKWRFYPGNNLASHVLGFVGYIGDELAGRYGLEKKYNKELSRDKDNPYVNFFAEVFSNLKNGKQNGDIVMSIEPIVQNFLEKKMLEVKEKYQIDSIGGIIMNPKNGAIYAMGVQPDFDLNNFSKVKDISLLGNPLVENVFEFGSVVKPLIMAAGLDTVVITAETTYDDKGFVIVDKRIINNFDKKKRGIINMQEVLGKSLNTGMHFVYQKLGKDIMRDYMLSYGIKDKTGIDLPNETNSLISNLYGSKDLEYVNATFGQGIALTPVALIRALASLANGGNLVTPHIIEKISFNDIIEEKKEYPIIPTKISKKTSEEITRMLVNVMDKYFKSGSMKLENHSIAVKTGTAQIAKENGGGYEEDKYTHAIVGYFPAYNPDFIILIYAVNPKDVSYSITTLSQPFLDTVKFLINYYEVKPDR